MLNSCQIVGYLNLTGISAVRGVGEILRFMGHLLVNGSPQKFRKVETPVQAMKQVVTGSIPVVPHISGIVRIFIPVCLIKQPNGSLTRIVSKAWRINQRGLRKVHSKLYSHPGFAVYTHSYSSNPHVRLQLNMRRILCVQAYRGLNE